MVIRSQVRNPKHCTSRILERGEDVLKHDEVLKYVRHGERKLLQESKKNTTHSFSHLNMFINLQLGIYNCSHFATTLVERDK